MGGATRRDFLKAGLRWDSGRDWRVLAERRRGNRPPIGWRWGNRA